MAKERIYEFDFEENPHLYQGSPYYEIDEAEPDSVTDEIAENPDSPFDIAPDRPFDFLDLIPAWTYIPPCGHKVYYRTRLTAIDRTDDEDVDRNPCYTADDDDGIRWGICRACKPWHYFKVDKRTIEIAPQTGQSEIITTTTHTKSKENMREKSIARAVDKGILQNRIARILWVLDYLDEKKSSDGIVKAFEGDGEIPKDDAEEIAREIGQPTKYRMVAEVANHGIIRVSPGRLAPTLKGRTTNRQKDKAADVWKKMVDDGSVSLRVSPGSVEDPEPQTPCEADKAADRWKNLMDHGSIYRTAPTLPSALHFFTPSDLRKHRYIRLKVAKTEYVSAPQPI